MAAIIEVISVLIVCYHAVAGDENPIVTVKQGSLKGLKKTSAYNTPYYAFLGIPYAKPPVGDRRFKVSFVNIY